MDAPKSEDKEDLEGLSGAFPVISEYAKSLEKHKSVKWVTNSMGGPGTDRVKQSYTKTQRNTAKRRKRRKKSSNHKLRVRFFKKIQDWILKSERIRKWILRFFTRRINQRSFGSWCVKGPEESSLEEDSSVPLTHHDPKDLGLIRLVKKRKIHFRILSDFRIQSWIFLKKRTLSFQKTSGEKVH